jgi:hypothetical protein
LKAVDEPVVFEKLAIVTEVVDVGTESAVKVVWLVEFVTSHAQPCGAAVGNAITPLVADPPVPTFTVKAWLDVPFGMDGDVQKSCLFYWKLACPDKAAEL